MFCYQENTHFSQAVACSREKFWESVRNTSTQWKIDSRREILDVVERKDEAGMAKWLSNTDYQKFLAKKRALKKEAARQKFFAKSDEERLLAFAQELKDNLTAFIFSCREFDETETAKGTMFRHRKLADCHLNGLVMLDIDHVENPMAVFDDLKANEALMARTKLVHITSSKKGVRIVFTADVETGNLADNQIVFAQALGYKADASCIDATRNSFAPKEEDILFIDETIFDYYDEAFDRSYTELYREKKTQPLNYEFPAGDEENESKDQRIKRIATGEALAEGDNPKILKSLDKKEEESTETKWRGYSVQEIIDKRFEGRLPCAKDSNRHKESLKLASDLLVLFDGDKKIALKVLVAQSWVKEIIDERDEDVEQTVASAAERMAEREKKYLTQMPSREMQDAIKTVTGKTYLQISQETSKGGATDAVQSVASQRMDRQLWRWGEEIERLSDDFPLIKDIVKGLKPNQYPAALFVGGGLLMTLMTRCTYRFYHRPEELRRLNSSVMIIGDPASGKSFATRLFNLLAQPIVLADKKGKDAINAYREAVRSKGANKEKPPKPKVVVRSHPARTSNAQFIQDMVNAVEVVDGEEMQLHMLTFDTELDNTLTVQKGGSWIDKMSLELKAFHNEIDGQAYSNNDSVMQDFHVTWNYVYTGTPKALKKKVNAQNFGSGLALRLTCIPLPATQFEMMERETSLDHDSDDRLKTWAFKLDRTKGELPLGKIVDELYDWTARRMADAKENQSQAQEMLLKRCAYHGLNFSAPFIVMRHWDKMHQDGQYWCGEFETDEKDWALAELIVNMQYACQLHYFGVYAEQYFDDKARDDEANVMHRQKTVDGYNSLPEVFSIDDVLRCFRLDNRNSARSKVLRFIKDHLALKLESVVENGTQRARYQKTRSIMD